MVPRHTEERMEQVLQAAAILATFVTLWFLSAVSALDDLAWIEGPRRARGPAEPE
jgi:hypothetical protein